MTLRIVNTDMSGGGAQIDLGTTDDLFLTADSMIASNGGVTSTIIGLGAHHAADIYGTVVGAGVALTLGDSGLSDWDQFLHVAPSGVIRGFEDYAVTIFGYQQKIDNEGRIDGADGLDSQGSHDPGATTIVNSGTIIGRSNIAVHRAGTESFTIENSGLIKGANYGIHASGNTGDARIFNTGKIIGLITTSDGEDLYDGRGGMNLGMVFTGDGADRLIGGKATDVFGGGHGRDRMTGGGGGDEFVFLVTGDSTALATNRDIITDFSRRQGDLIDLSAIDARPATGADNSFHFVGTHAFTGDAGELRYGNHDGHTYVYGDVDGDRHADLAIDLIGTLELLRGDFDL